MNDHLLKKFLNGHADDEEIRQCETLLDDPRTIVEASAPDDADPLVASLRAQRSQPNDDHASSAELLQRIEGFVRLQSVHREDLERLFDPPQQPDELGRIGKYRVVEFIAGGGMGLVFKAQDAELGRLVCIKIMHPALALKPDAKLRFERESRAAAQLRSERVVTLLDIGRQRDLPYIVMQLLDGESLRSKLSRDGKLSPEVAVRYAIQVAEGLRHAHSMGILHRDIKPDNIWITPEGDIKLLDFGLARPLDEAVELTTSGGIVGTPQYMSPEQIQGKPLDARSDLFSLGIVLFEMLAGHLPFQENNLFSTMVAITNDSVALPASELTSGMASAPAMELESILQGLLKKDRSQRIQTAQQLIDGLGRLMLQSSSTPPSAVHVRRSGAGGGGRGGFRRWSYALMGLAAGLAAMLLGVVVVQATDRGTLVVRTQDPQVEVRVAQEKVTIRDPLSGRSFELTIGATKLPGGVYQLEMNEAASGLTFSSRTIAIRRGETVVVEVELQPLPSKVTPSAQAAAAELASGAPAPTPAAEASDADKNADPSFDATARENFARVLERLPALAVDPGAASVAGADALDQAGLSAIEQKKIPGIDSWSIDTDNSFGFGIDRNCNGTLFASIHRNSVHIWDKGLKLKYILPLSTIPIGFSFDNTYPNLIAVSGYRAPMTQIEVPNSLNNEVTIWRLGANYAEIIHRFPASQYELAWDQGYRLFHRGEHGLSVFRLDEGKSYAIHADTGRIGKDAISPNGRYVVSSSERNMDVWDLKRGEFAFSALGSGRNQWNRQGDRVAFFSSRSTGLEIWNLDERSIDDKVELPVETVSQSRMVPRGKTLIGLEPTFQRLAWLTPQGRLTVRNLQTNREDSQQLPDANGLSIRRGRIEWEGGNFIVETDQASYAWHHEKSDVQGNLQTCEPTPIAQTKRGTELRFAPALGDATPLLLWNDSDARERNLGKQSNATDLENEAYFDAFDTRSNSFLHEFPFAFVHPGFSPASGANSDRSFSGRPSFSPDGRYAVAHTVNSTPGREFGRLREVKFFSLIDLEPPLKLDVDYRTEAVWDNGSRFALFSHPTAFNEQFTFKIYDAKERHLVDTESPKLTAGRVVYLKPGHGKFFAFIRTVSKDALDDSSRTSRNRPQFSGDFHVWIIDPVRQVVRESSGVTQLLAKLSAIDSVQTTDDYVFVSALAPDHSEDKPANVKKIYRIAIEEERGQGVECITVPLVDDVYFSNSGNYLLQERRDADVIYTKGMAGQRTRTLSTKGPGEVFVARWADIAESLGNVQELPNQATDKTVDWTKLTQVKHKLATAASGYVRGLQWHPKADVVTWTTNGFLTFFDTQQEKTRTHVSLGQNLVAIASNSGWISAEDSDVHFFDMHGAQTCRLAFDPLLADFKPARARWILADGSIQAGSSGQGLAISYLVNNRFFTQSVEEYERTHPDVRLPRFDQLPIVQQ
jgi:hypothetical protein